MFGLQRTTQNAEPAKQKTNGEHKMKKKILLLIALLHFIETGLFAGRHGDGG